MDGLFLLSFASLVVPKFVLFSVVLSIGVLILQKEEENAKGKVFMHLSLELERLRHLLLVWLLCWCLVPRVLLRSDSFLLSQYS